MPKKRRTARELLELARIVACYSYAYFSDALWALQFVEARPGELPPCADIAVNPAYRCVYDPVGIGKRTVEALVAVLLHEISHNLRDHGTRARLLSIPPELHLLANVAQDEEINDDLRQMVSGCGKEWVYPEQFGHAEGRLWEEYYRDHLSQATVIKIRPPGGVGRGGCGTCASGEPEGADEASQDAIDGLSPIEREWLKEQVAQAMREQAASAPGSLPGGWARWAESIFGTRIDVWAMLRGAILGQIKMAWGYRVTCHRKIHKRQEEWGDVLVPVLRAPMPNIAVIIDTSGSMSKQQLGKAIGIVASVLKQVRQRITVLAVDAAVYQQQSIYRPEQIALVGGGGTDMAYAITYADGLSPRPDAIIVITDCCTGWPAAPPRSRLLIVKVGEGQPPPFGKVVDVSEGEL